MTSWEHWTNQLVEATKGARKVNGFTSGTLALQERRVNHDPYPYQSVWQDGSRGGRYAEDVSEWTHLSIVYDPRPWYDVQDNPILADLREDIARGIPDPIGQYIAMLEGHYGEPSNGPFHVHARRVLEKLAALA